MLKGTSHTTIGICDQEVADFQINGFAIWRFEEGTVFPLTTLTLPVKLLQGDRWEILWIPNFSI